MKVLLSAALLALAGCGSTPTKTAYVSPAPGTIRGPSGATYYLPRNLVSQEPQVIYQPVYQPTYQSPQESEQDKLIREMHERQARDNQQQILDNQTRQDYYPRRVINPQNGQVIGIVPGVVGE
jgi:hypothetical protein